MTSGLSIAGVTYRNLLAWQECRRLVKAVYRATEHFPASERYGLTAQMRRAAVSAACNIAEGFGRWGAGESAHGASIALGSLAELDTLFVLSEDLELFTGSLAAELEAIRAEAGRYTWGLLRKAQRARS